MYSLLGLLIFLFVIILFIESVFYIYLFLYIVWRNLQKKIEEQARKKHARS
jgi:predicted membrane protein